MPNWPVAKWKDKFPDASHFLYGMYWKPLPEKKAQGILWPLENSATAVIWRRAVDLDIPIR
jgi:hypothetical protein